MVTIAWPPFVVTEIFFKFYHTHTNALNKILHSPLAFNFVTYTKQLFTITDRVDFPKRDLRYNGVEVNTQSDHLQPEVGEHRRMWDERTKKTVSFLACK